MLFLECYAQIFITVYYYKRNISIVEVEIRTPQGSSSCLVPSCPEEGSREGVTADMCVMLTPASHGLHPASECHPVLGPWKKTGEEGRWFHKLSVNPQTDLQSR